MRPLLLRAASLAAILALGLIQPALAKKFAADVLASGATPEEKGRAIALEADARDEGFGDQSAVVTMVLRDQNGKETRRQSRNLTFETPAREMGDKSLIVFESPNDIKETVMLTHSRILDSDDQWIYLPALKRVKRIASENKSGAFVGSEFAFEDLSSQEPDKFSHKYLKDEPCPVPADRTCFVVEQVPQYENSGYTRRLAWIDHQDFQIRKLDFYDRKESLLKTMTFDGYQQFLGQYWRPGKMSMVNHQNGRSTDLLWTDYKFRTGLAENEFVKDRMTARR